MLFLLFDQRIKDVWDAQTHSRTRSKPGRSSYRGICWLFIGIGLTVEPNWQGMDPHLRQVERSVDRRPSRIIVQD